MGRRITEQRRATAFATIDLDAPGKRAGHIMVPHSPHEDAWGATPVPIAVIAHGDGPTVIVEGGNHGDEYEGPIAIGELIRDLDASDVQGRLILLPAINVQAQMAGRRTSPVDGKNFNRTFPGNPLGSITEQISAYVTDELFPRADAFIDLHSGGSSLDILPSAILEPTDDAALMHRSVEAARAFDAPHIVIVGNLGDPRTSSAAACMAGLVMVGTEMGGGGTVSLEAMRLCRRGLRNVLAHLGVLPGHHRGVPAGDPQVLELPGSRAFVYATADGILEPFHPLGTAVRAGEPACRIHTPWDPTREPVTLAYQADGLLYGRRQPGRVQPGNCCLVVAAPSGLKL